MTDMVIKSCIVCGEDVEVIRNMPDDEPVLCIADYFAEDISEEWEREEE